MQFRLLAGRVFLVILVLFSAFVVQTSVFQLIPYFSTAPNLLLIVVFTLSFIYGSTVGMFCGLAAGLMMDLFYSGAFGFYSLFYLVTGYVNGIFTRFYYDEYIGLPLIMCTVNVLLYHLYIYAARFLFRGKLEIGYYFLHIVVPEMLFSLIVTLVIYRFILRAGKKLGEKKDERGQTIV